MSDPPVVRPEDLRGCVGAAVLDPADMARLVQDVLQHSGELQYRTGEREYDVTHHVFRFNTTDYPHVFEYGFQARPQGDTPDEIYFSLDHYVHHAGPPLDPNRPVTHVFTSTTLSSSYTPTPTETILPQGEQLQVYRYEIYAPGGINVSLTLGDRYLYPNQEEVSFVGGIAPRYIRSAQLFIGTRRQDDPRYIDWRRDPKIRVNGHWNSGSTRDIYLPVHYHMVLIDGRWRRVPLKINIWRPQLPDGRREKRDASDNIVDPAGYINAAFRSSRKYEAYLFMRNEYVLVNYAPGTTDDRIVNGPLLVCDGYPSLHDTPFGEYGIDCAFDCRGDQAFIFSGNLCAHIDYAPGTTDDRIIHGPMTITAMFPFFKGTVFANSIDAAFTSSATHEAYLFKGDSYANINYYSKTCIAIRKITEGFYSLRNTIFESGVQAAFASHRSQEAYIFKGEQYALINFARGTTDDYIIGGVNPITPNWPSLAEILPRENRGVDFHDDHNHQQARPDRDEL